MEAEGFAYWHVAGINVFLDSAGASVRDGAHIVFAGELVRPGEPTENPPIEAGVDTGEFRVLDLPALVQIKLTAFRDKDRTHIRDLIEVGLVDESWLPQLPEALAARLASILDDPFGQPSHSPTHQSTCYAGLPEEWPAKRTFGIQTDVKLARISPIR